MTLGEKLSALRKAQHMTQEQLAETLGVSRQSISKWESNLAYPETDKLLRLSDLFHCSLDELLRDGAEPPAAAPQGEPCRRVSVEEAEGVVQTARRAALPTAVATFLCIVSPCALMLLGAMAESGCFGVTENQAVGLGMVVLLGMVAVAVALFLLMDKRNAPFAYLESEPIVLAPGVRELAQAGKAADQARYARGNIVGTLLCIVSPIPLFVGIALFDGDDVMLMAMLCLMLLLIGLGVMGFILVGVPWASYAKLLQEGDYTPAMKASSRVIGMVSTAYWLIATAVYLLYSLITDDWQRSWVIWPVVGVLFPVVCMLVRMRAKRAS